MLVSKPFVLALVTKHHVPLLPISVHIRFQAVRHRLIRLNFQC